MAKRPLNNDARNLIRATRDSGGPLSGAYWSELRTFLAVAKLKSHNQAAHALNLGHQTVGRHVQRLEDVFGLKLIIASPKGAELTPKGKEIFGFLARLDKELFSVESDLRSSAQNAEGTVRIAVTDGLGLVFIAPAAVRFSERYPDVQLHLKRPNDLRQLSQDRADILIWFSSDKAPGITSKRVGRVHFAPYASRAYLDGLAADATLDFVDSERFQAPASPFRPWQALVATGRVRHLSDTSLTYATMVKAGIGVGLLPTYNDLEPGLCRVDPSVVIDVSLFASVLTDRLERTHIAAAWEFLVDLFAPTLTDDHAFDLEDGRSLAKGYTLVFNI